MEEQKELLLKLSNKLKLLKPNKQTLLDSGIIDVNGNISNDYPILKKYINYEN